MSCRFCDDFACDYDQQLTEHLRSKGETMRETLDAAEQKELDNLFTYHKPFGTQPERYERIRAAGKQLAEAILLNTPKSADQSAAIRKVREAVMTANAAIAVNEKETEAAGV